MLRGSKAHSLLAWIVSFSILCAVCIVLRFWSAGIQKRKYYADDFLVLVTYVGDASIHLVGLDGQTDSFLGRPAR